MRVPGITTILLFFASLLWSCGGSHDARIVAVLDRADSLLLTSDPALHDSVRQVGGARHRPRPAGRRGALHLCRRRAQAACGLRAQPLRYSR